MSRIPENRRLFMEIGLDNTTFQAVDGTEYESWIDGEFSDQNDHMVIQRLMFVSDVDENKTVKFDKKITNDIFELKEPFEVENITNGLYYYQKIIIPSKDHANESNESLYFDPDDELNRIVYKDLDSGREHQFPDFTTSFDEIFSIIINNNTLNCFYFADYILSIYDLLKCYIMTERERINNYLRNNCRADCDKNSDLGNRADILLAAIMVIKSLIEKGDYFEAQRILNGLNTCGELCKKYTNNLRGCGCGTT